MIYKDRIILREVGEEHLNQEKRNDSEITGHIVSHTVLMKYVFMVNFNGIEGCSHHLLRLEEMKKTPH